MLHNNGNVKVTDETILSKGGAFNVDIALQVHMACSQPTCNGSYNSLGAVCYQCMGRQRW